VIALDLGVLACAANRHAPEHARATAVVEGSPTATCRGRWPGRWCTSSSVWSPTARVVRPLEPSEASAFIERLLESPTSAARADVRPRPGPGRAAGFPGGTGRAAGGARNGGAAAEHGVRELLSPDRGMRRYRFLTVIDRSTATSGRRPRGRCGATGCCVPADGGSVRRRGGRAGSPGGGARHRYSRLIRPRSWDHGHRGVGQLETVDAKVAWICSGSCTKGARSCLRCTRSAPWSAAANVPPPELVRVKSASIGGR